MNENTLNKLKELVTKRQQIMNEYISHIKQLSLLYDKFEKSTPNIEDYDLEEAYELFYESKERDEWQTIKDTILEQIKSVENKIADIVIKNELLSQETMNIIKLCSFPEQLNTNIFNVISYKLQEIEEWTNCN